MEALTFSVCNTQRKDTSTSDWQTHCKHGLSGSTANVEKCNL